MSDSHWTHGWIDSSIPDWLEANRAQLPPEAIALVTTIDSGREVTRSPMIAKALGRPVETPGGQLKLTVVELLHVALAEACFLGFDEVWLLGSDSSDVVADGPVRLDCSAAPPIESREFHAWLETYDVLVGVGDGLGLAYVARVPEFSELRFSELG